MGDATVQQYHVKASTDISDTAIRCLEQCSRSDKPGVPGKVSHVVPKCPPKTNSKLGGSLTVLEAYSRWTGGIGEVLRIDSRSMQQYVRCVIEDPDCEKTYAISVTMLTGT